MSPVDQSRGHVGRAASVSLVGVVVVLGGLLLASFMLKATGKRGPGDTSFHGGSTSRLSAEIADRGPIFYGDVSGRKSRDMILQHLGKKDDKGWYAFLAAPPGKPRDCTWEWKAKEHQFRAKCDPSLTAPADGTGLKQFVVTISKGTIDVDLNASPTTSTTKPRSTTTTTAG